MSGGGGLLNLIATGNQNTILFGNPSKHSSKQNTLNIPILVCKNLD